ncbi:uncharacterized protein SOCE26_014730 [Sorangium cellulosum]|uniref:Uncharacterized protein n=1 Tax=Sorangium cellulosum TaxID=56 RepID=A0A2L0ELB1_SORCE|nr:hypothetical protein [Sorangium cellulosum]AUX40077.1 uncharacterized protein SOCE26_014730 [Sorangium cellulosum]
MRFSVPHRDAATPHDGRRRSARRHLGQVDVGAPLQPSLAGRHEVPARRELQGVLLHLVEGADVEERAAEVLLGVRHRVRERQALGVGQRAARIRTAASAYAPSSSQRCPALLRELHAAPSMRNPT